MDCICGVRKRIVRDVSQILPLAWGTQRKDWEFGYGHIELGMLVKQPNGETEKVAGYMQLQLRREFGLEGEKGLGVTDE